MVSPPISGLSNYEKERERNIMANRAVLASLGLLDAAVALHHEIASGSARSTKTNKPKVKKVWSEVAPCRESSGRAQKLEQEAAIEAAKEAKRRAAEEQLAAEKREHARRLRKEREVIARREAAKEARRKAKIEEERRPFCCCP